MTRVTTRETIAPATKRPRVNAVSGGWPGRSAMVAARSVSTGARFTRMGGGGRSLLALALEYDRDYLTHRITEEGGDVAAIGLV